MAAGHLRQHGCDRLVGADDIDLCTGNHRVFRRAGGEVEDPIEQGGQFGRQLAGLARFGDDVLEVACGCRVLHVMDWLDT